MHSQNNRHPAPTSLSTRVPPAEQAAAQIYIHSLKCTSVPQALYVLNSIQHAVSAVFVTPSHQSQ